MASRSGGGGEVFRLYGFCHFVKSLILIGVPPRRFGDVLSVECQVVLGGSGSATYCFCSETSELELFGDVRF